MTTVVYNKVAGVSDDSVIVLEADHSGTYTHTAGSTAETALYTYTLPGGTMGLNDSIRITTLWSHTDSVNDKRMEIKFGGVEIFNELETSGGLESMQSMQIVRNANSLSAQKFHQKNQETVFTKTVPHGTSSIDTTADVDIVFYATIATATETITLESYIIELIRA